MRIQSCSMDAKPIQIFLFHTPNDGSAGVTIMSCGKSAACYKKKTLTLFDVMTDKSVERFKKFCVYPPLRDNKRASYGENNRRFFLTKHKSYVKKKPLI